MSATPHFLRRLSRQVILLLSRWFITAVFRLNRLAVGGEQHLLEAVRAGRPVFVGIWHNRLLYPLWYLRRFRPLALVSRSSDGDLVAGLLASWGYRILRGSSTRGSGDALRGMMRGLERHDMLMVNAMDGPVGPPRIAKMGSVALAAKKDALLVPLAGAATRRWTFRNSWDHFQIPKPFGRILVQCGPPLTLPPGLADEEVARLMGQQIDKVEEQADAVAAHTG